MNAKIAFCAMSLILVASHAWAQRNDQVRFRNVGSESAQVVTDLGSNPIRSNFTLRGGAIQYVNVGKDDLRWCVHHASSPSCMPNAVVGPGGEVDFSVQPPLPRPPTPSQPGAGPGSTKRGLGQVCSTNTDCFSGHCYPGPGNNNEKYCLHARKNCAFPGNEGVMYGDVRGFDGSNWECYNPRREGEQATWRRLR